MKRTVSIASLVVARILVVSGSRVEATDRNTGLHEGDVVGAAGEHSRGDRDALRGEVLREELFNDLAPWCSYSAVRAAVAVKDAIVASRNLFAYTILVFSF